MTSKLRIFARRALLGAVVTSAACATKTSLPSIGGDWDIYLASGSTARPGFVGWRRMGFAHFAADSTHVGSVGGAPASRW